MHSAQHTSLPHHVVRLGSHRTQRRSPQYILQAADGQQIRKIRMPARKLLHDNSACNPVDPAAKIFPQSADVQLLSLANGRRVRVHPINVTAGIHSTARLPTGDLYWLYMRWLLLFAFLAAVSHAADIESRVTHGYADSNGVKIHYASLGKGPLVVMIHGFPDFWYTWRDQMEALSDNYQCVAI